MAEFDFASRLKVGTPQALAGRVLAGSAFEQEDEEQDEFSIDGMTPKQALIAAILNRREVMFDYTSEPDKFGKAASGRRVGKPHAMWQDKKGVVKVHVYIDPTSVTSSRSGSRWRPFTVNKIRNVRLVQKGPEITPGSNMVTPSPGWNPGFYARQGRVLAIIP
jgi:hypothetical protein